MSVQPKPKIHHQEIIERLEKSGWDVITIGGDIVVKNPNDPQPYKYWYVVPFLGSNKKHDDEVKQ